MESERTIRRANRHLWRALGLLVVGTGVSFGQSSPFVETRSFLSTSPSHVAAKRRAQTGDVTGDQRLDALILDAGEIWLFADPATSEAPVPTGVFATDFAVSESTIFFVDGGGIHFLSDYAAGSFTQSSRPSPLWNGALRVLAADLGASGTTDLVGVGSDGMSVVTARTVLDSSPVFTQFGVPSTIHDITIANWMGTEEPEILVLLSSGLYVHSREGVLLDHLPQAVESGLLGVLREPAYSFDRCLVMFTRAGIARRWVVDASLVEPPEALGPLKVGALATPDINEDGASDMLFFGPTNGDAYLAFNQNLRGSGSTFAPGAWSALGTGPLGRFQRAWPAAADFDNDGDKDLFFYEAGSNEWKYCSNTTVDAGAQSVVIDEGVALLDDTLAIGTPVTLGLTVTVPGAYGFVEVLVWSQDATESFDMATNAVPAFQGVFPVAADRTAAPVIDLGDYSSVLATAFYIDIRGVDGDAVLGVITGVGPSSVSACVVGEEIVDDLMLHYGGQHGGQLSVEVMYVSALGGGPALTFLGREVGSVIIGIPNDGVPPFDVPPTPDEDPTWY